MKHGSAVTILFISSIGWGLTWLPIKSINQMGLDGIYLVFIAFTCAGLLLSPYLFTQRRSWRGNMRFLLLIALIGGLANLSFQTALVHGNVVRVMILFYLLPVWSILGAWYILNEKPDWVRMVAVVISLSGAMLILNVDGKTFSGLNWVDVTAIVAGMTFALNNIYFRKTAEQPLAGKVSAMFLGCAVLMGGYLLFNPVATAIPDNLSPLYAGLYGVFFLGLITFGTQWGVTQLEAGRSALIIVMELVAAVISVALLTETQLSPREIAGAALVLTAAVVEGWREPEPATA
ncbi:MAG: DMT family transporter [Gammaproteobacteria bacterium]|jgi:drug/metabolite transporter (DMT)-like permease